MFSSENIQSKNLTKSEIKALDYLTKHQQRIPFLAIGEITQEIGISNATLTRLAKKLGFQNLRQLKHSLIPAEEPSPRSKLENVQNKSAVDEKAPFLAGELQHLLTTIQHLDIAKLQTAAELVIQQQHVFIFSKGSAICCGDLLTFRLNRFGKKVSHHCRNGSEIFESLHQITPADLVILFGFGKIPKEIRTVLDYCEKQNIPNLLVTDQLYLPVPKVHPLTFYTDRGQPEDFHSMTAPIALVDALVIEIAKIAPASYKEQLEKLHKIKQSYRKDFPK